MKKEQIKKEDLVNASGGMRIVLMDFRGGKVGKGDPCVLSKRTMIDQNGEKRCVIYEIYRSGNEAQAAGLSSIGQEFESEEDLINWIKKNEIKLSSTYSYDVKDPINM